MPSEACLDIVSDLLARAQRPLIITGAGISADSGLPTYRGFGGLYDNKLTADGISIEEALSGDVFAAQPEVTWKYLAEIERSCRGAQPNDAHIILARYEQRCPEMWLLTQNIDGLHHKAGSCNLIEMHGTLYRLLCTQCQQYTEVDDFSALRFPPSCPECAGLLRPDVVLFGEMLPQAALAQLNHVLQRGVDLVVSIGTSSVFPYIAGPMLLAARHNTPTVEINPDETEISHCARYRLGLRAEQAMQALWQRLK